MLRKVIVVSLSLMTDSSQMHDVCMWHATKGLAFGSSYLSPEIE